MTPPGALWALPFAALLLSIALLPMAAPGFWHRHTAAVAFGWCAALLLPYAAVFGAEAALRQLAETLLHDGLPFVLLLTALYTAAGGIHLRGDLRATPARNTALLGVGTLLASVLGTTGAAMLLIGPLLRANAHRPQAAHVVVFFIFLVGNIGGALTPLGDPPLLLGFLHGVDFFWTTTHLAAPTGFVVACLLALFFVIDTRHSAREPRPVWSASTGAPLGIDGAANLLPLAAIVALTALGGIWRPAAVLHVAGVEIGLAPLVRDLGLIAATGVSLAITPRGLRAANDFSWAPMREVAVLFVGIFVTMMPVLATLKAGEGGAFAGLLRLVATPAGEPRPWASFWVTGLVSAFLDNAPTYLVFFESAGGDARRLMTELAGTLAAISAGAVFMGAMTYIGNAPNLMIRAIAERHGVRMPGFFGYMAWSGIILLPLYLLVALVWFS